MNKAPDNINLNNTSNELLSCFDDDGNPISPKTRKKLHTEPYNTWHAVVNVWVLNKDELVLCSKRSDTVSGNPGKWQTYFGGHVKAGHSFSDTIIAELNEEIGLSVELEKLHLIDKGKDQSVKHFYESYAYLFSGKLENLKFNDGEVSEVKWMTIEDYWNDKQNHPEKWCNNLNPENQVKVRKYLNSL